MLTLGKSSAVENLYAGIFRRFPSLSMMPLMKLERRTLYAKAKKGEPRALLKEYFENTEIMKSYPLFWTDLQKKQLFANLSPNFLYCFNILFGSHRLKSIRDWWLCTL